MSDHDIAKAMNQLWGQAFYGWTKDATPGGSMRWMDGKGYFEFRLQGAVYSVVVGAVEDKPKEEA